MRVPAINGSTDGVLVCTRMTTQSLRRAANHSFARHAAFPSTATYNDAYCDGGVAQRRNSRTKESEAAGKPSTLTSVCSDACKEVHTSALSRESLAPESVPAEEQGWQKVKAKRRRGRKENKREDEADVKTATPLNQQASKPSKQSQPKPQWLHVKNLTPSQQPDQRRGQSTHLEPRISPETEEVDGVRRV